MLEQLYKYKSELKKDGIIFSFVGPISQDVVEGIGSVLREKMETEDINSNTSLKVFAIFVEQMQNVINYSVDRVPENNFDSHISFGMIIVGQNEGKYFIIGGNRVSNVQKERIEKKLSILSNMDKQELRAYYREQRKIDPDEYSKGAGLGFIEMAKKSTEPLEYNFEPIDEENSYFTIKTIV